MNTRSKIPLIILIPYVSALIFVFAINADTYEGKNLNGTMDTGKIISESAFSAEPRMAEALPANVLSAGVSRSDALPVEVLSTKAVSEEDVKIKKDQAVEIAKAYLDNPSLYNVYSVDFKENNGINEVSGAVWEVFAGNRASVDYGVKVIVESTTVTVDATTGEVVGYSWSSSDSQNGSENLMTREEAAGIAVKILKDKFHLNAGNFELQNKDKGIYDMKIPVNGKTSVYYFSFTRKINGAYFPYETISIVIDSMTGQLVNYRHNAVPLDIAALPSGENVISADKAMEEFRKAMNWSLQYITWYRENSDGYFEPFAIPAYVPTVNVKKMDAVSGKPLHEDAYVISDGSQVQVSDHLRPLIPDARLESEEITEEEAKVLAERYKKSVEKLSGIEFDAAVIHDYPDPYTQCNYPDLYGGSMKKWEGSLNKKDKNVNYNFNISINQETGHIANLTFSSDVYPPVQVKENVSWAAGKSKALEFVKAVFPETYGFYAELNRKQPVLQEHALKYSPAHYFIFRRVVNGIMVQDDYISVGVDRETGELRSLNYHWSDLEFPDLAGIISKDAAEDIYFSDMEARLTYSVNIVDENKVGDNEPILFYNFVGKGNWHGPDVPVNAVTGGLVGLDM